MPIANDRNPPQCRDGANFVRLGHCGAGHPELLSARFPPRPLEPCDALGRSQVVRQRILIPPSGGSNPPAPANDFNRLANNRPVRFSAMSAPCRHERVNHRWWKGSPRIYFRRRFLLKLRWADGLGGSDAKPRAVWRQTRIRPIQPYCGPTPGGPRRSAGGEPLAA